MRTKPKLLIDGDLYIYRITAASEVEIDWGNDLWTLHSDFKSLSTMFDSEMKLLAKKLKSSSIVIALSDTANFRKKVCPGYKSGRKSRKPLAYSGLVSYVRSNYDTIVLPNLEADDTLGLLAYRHPRSIIVSWDKDMGQVAGTHYDPLQNKTTKVSKDEGWRYFMSQVLTGDRVDGYPGCPGCGAVKAEKILTKSCDWSAIVDAYESAGLDESSALVQARLAYILKHPEDYNQQTGEVNLWKPK